MTQRNFTKTAALALVSIALLGTNLPSASADTATTFAVAKPSVSSTSVESHSTAAATFTQSTPAIVLAQSASGRSSLAQVKITDSLTGLAFKDVDGSITLLPSSFNSIDANAYPTNHGIVFESGTSFTYQSTTAIVAGTAPTSLGSIAPAATGYAREVMSVTAVDAGVYVSTFDTQLGTTEPELGTGHVWFLEAGKSPVNALSISGGYFADFSLTPGSTTTGSAIVIGLGNATTSDLMSVTVNSNHVISIVGTPAGTELSSDVVDQVLAWGMKGSAYVPLIVKVLTDSTDITNQSGDVLASYDADTNLLLAPNPGAFVYNSTVANPLLTTVQFPTAITPVYAYGKKVSTTALINNAGLGYAFSTAAKIYLVAKGNTVELPSSGLAVTSNFCITTTSAATSFTTGATTSVCAKVTHNLVAKIKKKVVTVTTSATKVTVELQVVKGKKTTWTKTPIKVTLKKGVAKVTFKKAGVYRFIGAATSTNNAVTSGNIKIK